MDYPGKIITKNATAPTQASASGVWTVDDALIALRSNTWPIAGVLNPISKSLRFNSADSAYLNRTPTSASNRKTWTWSAWIKRSALSGNAVFSAGDGSTGNRAAIDFDSDQFRVIFGDGTSLIGTTQVFRDPSAWYHFVVAVDTTQATASNRVKLYVNGSEITALSSTSYPAQNYDTFVNATNLHTLGARYRTSVDSYFNGYMTEVNFIDGQALTPSSFGATDAQTGQWIPKKYTGTYGTNGFYVNFSDSASTGALGTDYSGNGNNWTPNNFSVTAGAGNDSLTDVPTPWIAYSTNAEAGAVIRGNYCTLNPLNNAASLFNGNLDSGTASAIANWLPTSATLGVSSGKWYWEVRMNSAEYLQVGIFPITYAATSGTYPGSASTSGYGYQSANGNKYVLGTGSSYGATFTTGDVIGVALDLDAGTLVFYKNNVSQGTAATSISGTWLPGIAVYNSTGASTVANCNFGQRPFAYTPPAGFKSLCATNLPTPTIGATTTTQANDYFNTVLYTGNRPSTQSITGVGFQPDFVWIKGRDSTWFHRLYDAVRGVTKAIESNTTSAEFTASGLTSFNSDGFTVGSDPSENQPSQGFVAWNWNAGGSNATNTSGSITSTVRANTTAGFSIVTYTGTGANATVGHGLGVAPSMIIQKNLTGFNWRVYHVSTGNGNELYLDLTTAATSASTWNNTTPTSTVFSIGSGSAINGGSNACVAYCFAPIAGYSAFGSYTGNGSSDGPFIFTGFRPRYLLIKDTTGATNNWVVLDTSRSPYNAAALGLYPNTSNADDAFTYADILSNGFKIRNSSGNTNTSSSIYIYAAFAEFPFKFANAR